MMLSFIRVVIPCIYNRLQQKLSLAVGSIIWFELGFVELQKVQSLVPMDKTPQIVIKSMLYTCIALFLLYSYIRIGLLVWKIIVHYLTNTCLVDDDRDSLPWGLKRISCSEVEGMIGLMLPGLRGKSVL
jgi:hypothetical protein